jgi:hypothetical protein
MRALLTTTMALGVVLTLGANQPVNAAASDSVGSHQQGQIILARGGHGGGGHGHGGGGHWHGGGGHWGGGHHHGYWGGGGGYYGGPGYYYGPDYDYDYDTGPGGICIGPLCLGF